MVGISIKKNNRLIDFIIFIFKLKRINKNKKFSQIPADFNADVADL